MPIVSLVLLAILAIIWGASYLFIKLLLVDMGPMAINLARCLIGALVLWAVVWMRRVPLPRAASVWLRLLFVGVAGIGLPFSAIAWGTQHIPSGMSAILVGAMPIFTYLLVLLIGDERATFRRALGILIGFGGIVVLMLPELGGAGTRLALWGELAILAASVSYAISITFARHQLEGVPSILIGTGQVTWALALFAPLALLERRLPVQVPGLGSAVSLLVLGALGTGAAYLIYYKLMRDVGVTATSLVSYLIPPVGVFWGWVVLREQLHWTAFAAMALVLVGMALVNTRQTLAPSAVRAVAER